MNIKLTDEAKAYLKGHNKSAIMVYVKKSVSVLPEMGHVNITEVHLDKPDAEHIDSFDKFEFDGIDIYFEKAFEQFQEEVTFKLEHAFFLKWLTVTGLKID